MPGQFQIISLVSADDELLAIWEKARHVGRGGAVTRASYLIDRLLAKNPHAGHMIGDPNLWAVKFPPLAAFYEIHEEDMTVLIKRFLRVRD